MSVRTARPKDAPALAALHALCFPHPWPEEDFRTHIARDLVLVTPDLDGFVALRSGGGQAEILTLAVHPGHRRKGLARDLVLAARARLRDGPLFLEVAEDNAPALALYRALGFTPFGRRPAYYRRKGGRVAAVLMEWRSE